jgi:hypothetical protein
MAAMGFDLGRIERSDEPVQGWRVWNLREDPWQLEPAGSGVDAWPPGRAVEARCGASPILTWRHPHSAPDPGCTCGIYGATSLAIFDRPRPAWPPPSIVGTVALWGRVIEHERGWRAAFAYPARLRLVCAMCAWFEPGPGVPVAVHRFAGRLYGLCERHRGGIQVPDGRVSRPTDLDPLAVQSRLLDAYGVDLVPIEQIEFLFRSPPTAEPPSYIPSIRVVPLSP